MRVRGNSWSKHPMISRSTCAHPVREFLLKPLGGSAMERKRRFCAGAKWPPSGQSHSPGGKDLGCGGQTPSGRPNGSPFEVCDFGDSFSNPHAWAGGMHQLKWTNDLFLHRTYFKAFLVEVRESLKDTRVPLGLVAGRPRRRASSDTWYGLVGWQAFLPSVLTNRICTWSVTLGKTGSMNGATGPQPLPSPFLLSCAGGGANRAEACSETAKENLGMKEPTEAEPNSPEPKMPGRCHCHSRHPDSFSTYFPTCWSRSTGVWTYSRALQTRLHAWPAPPNAPPSPPERSRPPHACCCLRGSAGTPLTCLRTTWALQTKGSFWSHSLDRKRPAALNSQIHSTFSTCAILPVIKVFLNGRKCYQTLSTLLDDMFVFQFLPREIMDFP